MHFTHSAILYPFLILSLFILFFYFSTLVTIHQIQIKKERDEQVVKGVILGRNQCKVGVLGEGPELPWNLFTIITKEEEERRRAGEKGKERRKEDEKERREREDKRGGRDKTMKERRKRRKKGKRRKGESTFMAGSSSDATVSFICLTFFLSNNEL